MFEQYKPKFVFMIRPRIEHRAEKNCWVDKIPRSATGDFFFKVVQYKKKN